MLAPADKKWIRRCVREVVEEIVVAQLEIFANELSQRLDEMDAAPSQVGGYDGAIRVPDESEGEDASRRRRAVLGFTR